MPPEALTVDSAVSLLDAPAPEEQAPVVAAEPVEVETPPVEGDHEILADPEAEVEAAPDEAGDEAEPAEPELTLPAIAPPRSWDAAAQAQFAELPRELQTFVSEREADRDRSVSMAIQDASEAKKAATADVAKIDTLAKQLSEFLPEALKTFQSHWGDKPDWAAAVEQLGADEAMKLKFRYEQEQQQLGELIRKENEAKDLAHQQWVKAERTKLAELSPVLGDPTSGPKVLTQVAEYALREGYAKVDDLKYVSAPQFVMAHKAMLYDALPAAVKAGDLSGILKTLQPAPKPATPAARPAVRPTAAVPAPSQARAARDIEGRFAKSGSIDDAVALLIARKK